MEEIEPTGELAELFRSYYDRGGVIDFVLIRSSNHELSDYELHRQVALCTLQIVDRKRQLAVLPFRRLTSQPEKITGHSITASEFVGPFFDFNERRLVDHGDIRFSTLSNVKDECINTPDSDLGYAYAFSCNPHGLSGTNEENTLLFLEMNQHLFGNFAIELDVFAWSTDWSNYFDDGHEWWGSFLWTVHNHQQGFIVGIAASTTD